MSNTSNFDGLFDEMLPKPAQEKKSEPVIKDTDMIQTSYLLVNAMFELLLRKGIIREDEVGVLIADLALAMQRGRGTAS